MIWIDLIAVSEEPTHKQQRYLDLPVTIFGPFRPNNTKRELISQKELINDKFRKT